MRETLHFLLRRMTLPRHVKVFPPLESDPELFTHLLHALGASGATHFEDVYSIDDTNFSASAAEAFVLIAPCEDDYEESLQREESQRMASMTAEEIKRADSVIWVQQTIHNACGFYALLHAVLNISSAPRRFSPGSVLDTLLKSGSREKRQAILETSQALDEAYIPIALQGPQLRRTGRGNRHFTIYALSRFRIEYGSWTEIEEGR